MVEVPDFSLDDSEEHLKGENKEMFMRFVRKMLRWDPEERRSAREILTNPWLVAKQLSNQAISLPVMIMYASNAVNYGRMSSQR